jgi:hypothetical protein
MTKRRYETTMMRAVESLAVGAGVMSILILIWSGFDVLTAPGTTTWGLGMLPGIFGFVVVCLWLFYVVCAIGLAAIASPAWWLLHKLGRRNWIDAILLGAVLSYGAPFALSLLDSPQSGPPWQNSSGDYTLIYHPPRKPKWLETALSPVPLGVIGAMTGFVIWCRAYRRVDAEMDKQRARVTSGDTQA